MDDIVGFVCGFGIVVENPKIPIRKYSAHAIERIIQRHITASDINQWLRSPLVVFSQDRGTKYMFLTDLGYLIIDNQGAIVTALAARDYDKPIESTINLMKQNLRRKYRSRRP